MERAAFRQFATLEDTHWWFAGRRRLYMALLASNLARTGAPTTELRVLDVGCGVGGFLRPLERFGPVVGMELDHPALDWCRGRGLHRILQGRSERLPVAAGSQDLLTLFDVIEHTPDDQAVLVEAYRALRPGGHLALSVPAYPWLYANNDRMAHHYRRYRRAPLVTSLAKAGFEVVQATYVNVLLGIGIIPAVLLIKGTERLLGTRPGPRSNLSWPIPTPLGAVLAWIFGAERHILRRVSVPFGHSIFVFARRPGSAP